MTTLFKIGEISKLYNISVDTLRYYDEKGLLKPIVDPNSGYRFYTMEHLDILEMILVGKYLDVPLKDLKIIIDSEDIYRYTDLMKSQLSTIDKKIEELQRLKEYTNRLCLSLDNIPTIDLDINNLKKSDIYTTVVMFQIEDLIQISSKVESVKFTSIDQWISLIPGEDIHMNQIGISIKDIHMNMPEVISLYEEVFNDPTTISYEITDDYCYLEFWGNEKELNDYLHQISNHYQHFDHPIYIQFIFSLVHNNSIHEHYTKIYFKVD